MTWGASSNHPEIDQIRKGSYAKPSDHPVFSSQMRGVQEYICLCTPTNAAEVVFLAASTNFNDKLL